MLTQFDISGIEVCLDVRNAALNIMQHWKVTRDCVFILEGPEYSRVLNGCEIDGSRKWHIETIRNALWLRDKFDEILKAQIGSV